MKKLKVFSVLSLSLLLTLAVSPVSAEDVTDPIVPPVKSNLAGRNNCIKTALDVTDRTIETAISVHAKNIQSLKANRTKEVVKKNLNVNKKIIQVKEVKANLIDFAKLKTSRSAAWSDFRTAVKTCKTIAEN